MFSVTLLVISTCSQIFLEPDVNVHQIATSSP
jgi:hypothetical protein